MGPACELHVVVGGVAQVGLDESSCSIGVDTRQADISDVDLVGEGEGEAPPGDVTTPRLQPTQVQLGICLGSCHLGVTNAN